MQRALPLPLYQVSPSSEPLILLLNTEPDRNLYKPFWVVGRVSKILKRNLDSTMAVTRACLTCPRPHCLFLLIRISRAQSEFPRIHRPHQLIDSYIVGTSASTVLPISYRTSPPPTLTPSSTISAQTISTVPSNLSSRTAPKIWPPFPFPTLT